ncbi:MAG: PfkB family carbohydrate kinase [Pseudolysinimonas sp.]
MIAVLSPSPALDVTYLVGSLVAGEIHRPREVLRLPGGKGLNLARAAAVLGEIVRVVAPIGGNVGELVAELAELEGLQLDAVVVGAEARSCVSAIPDAGAPTEFYEPPAPLTEPEARALSLHFAGLPAGSWSALAGSLPDMKGLGDALLSRRAAGDRIAVDSSGQPLALLLAEVAPDLLKINAAEAAELLGDSGSPVELASALHGHTGGAVVITNGARGAVGVDAAGAWQAQPDPQPGRYAIGSGDSFFAGLLVALAVGAALPDALHAGSAAGSANTRAPGAGVFTRADYDAALNRIRVVMP